MAPEISPPSLSRGAVNVNLLISETRFGGWPAAKGNRGHAKDTDLAVEGERDDRSRPDFLGGFGHTPAVKPHMALLDQSLRQRAAFHEADEEEVAVKAHPLLTLEAGQCCEGIAGARALRFAVVGAPMAAPFPGLA